MVHFGSGSDDAKRALLFSSTNRYASDLFGKQTGQKTDNLWGVAGAVVFQQVEVTELAEMEALEMSKVASKPLELD